MVKKTKRYSIEVCRTGYSSLNIDVEATSVKDAKAKALDAAGSFEFSEHDADYSVGGYREIRPAKLSPLDKALNAKESNDTNYQDEEFPKSEWREDVRAGDTHMGYLDWVIHNIKG
jgi:hypothetical protein